MPLSDSERKARSDRAKRRREAKAAGTYVPRSGRKEAKKLARQEEAKRLQARIAMKAASAQQQKRRSKSDLRKGDWDPSIPKPVFRIDEPVLIKAMITSIVHPGDTGQMRYTIRPIRGPKNFDKYHPQWTVEEDKLTRWPRKK